MIVKNQKLCFITDPITYEMMDSDGEHFTGILYKEELEKV